jgi:SSS family solute:Na+ symporter
MHWLDYAILISVLIGLLAVGFILARTGSKDTTEYFVAGRKMPWWLIGFSDVAVGLNTSNMLQDSRKVRQDGVIGLMHVWGYALKSCIAGVFFDRLWRRAAFNTQMEFYEARYSGWRADFARVFDTIVFGGFVSSIWAAIGLVGMKKVATVVLGLPPTFELLGFAVSTEVAVVVGVVSIALCYSAASGARGVYWTDLIEFIIAVIPLYVLFLILYFQIGGSFGLRENLESLGAGSDRYLEFLQPLSIIYLYMFFVNPILDHGGFNPGMQRTLSLKDEREVLYTLIFKNVVGFVIRGMPFIAIGLMGIFFISDDFLLANFDALSTPEGNLIPDWERAFPALVDQYLPIGLTGMMAAAFVCAFMSSFDSNIHLSGSVIVNDFYRPYLVKNKGEGHYVTATRVVMFLASIGTILIGIFADDILYLGYLALTISLGGGWFKLLRLIWWRVNGTSEVAAQIFSIIVFAIVLSPLGESLVVSLTGAMGLEGNDAFYVTRNMLAGGSCTLFAFVVMMVTKPEPMSKLTAFYRRMRPFGWWGPVRRELGDTVASPDPIGLQVALTVSIVAIVWGACLGAMSLLLAYWWAASICFVFLVAGSFGARRYILKLYPAGREIAEYEPTPKPPVP